MITLIRPVRKHFAVQLYFSFADPKNWVYCYSLLADIEIAIALVEKPFSIR